MKRMILPILVVALMSLFAICLPKKCIAQSPATSYLNSNVDNSAALAQTARTPTRALFSYNTYSILGWSSRPCKPAHRWLLEPSPFAPSYYYQYRQSPLLRGDYLYRYDHHHRYDYRGYR